ncbi:MAG: cytochrome c oxidase accessory protein CcoG, partial [Methylocystis sp.]
DKDAQGRFIVEVGADQTREARVLLTMHGVHADKAPLAVDFTAHEIDTDKSISSRDVFLWP